MMSSIRTLLICTGLCVFALGIVTNERQNPVKGNLRTLFTDPHLQPDFTHASWTSFTEAYSGFIVVAGSLLFIEKRKATTENA